jgi:hypothetical protein
MRKLTFVVAALIALTATSYAVAHGIEGAKNAKAVAGTFTATAGSTTSRTCTTTDNKTIVVTDAKYKGAATGDPDLTGAITLRARSVVNTTDGVGTVSGSLEIDATGKNTRASFSTVYDHGNIAGLAAGHAHESKTALVANLSAGFDPATGFTNGKLGGGTAGGSAVEVGSGGCKPAQQTHEKSSARGTISALSASSITVAGLTCAIPADKSAGILAKYKQNDTVQIGCELANGANTLTSISSKHHD